MGAILLVLGLAGVVALFATGVIGGEALGAFALSSDCKKLLLEGRSDDDVEAWAKKHLEPPLLQVLGMGGLGQPELSIQLQFDDGVGQDVPVSARVTSASHPYAIAAYLYQQTVPAACRVIQVRRLGWETPAAGLQPMNPAEVILPTPAATSWFWILVVLVKVLYHMAGHKGPHYDVLPGELELAGTGVQLGVPADFEDKLVLDGGGLDADTADEPLVLTGIPAKLKIAATPAKLKLAAVPATPHYELDNIPAKVVKLALTREMLCEGRSSLGVKGTEQINGHLIDWTKNGALEFVTPQGDRHSDWLFFKYCFGYVNGEHTDELDAEKGYYVVVWPGDGREHMAVASGPYQNLLHIKPQGRPADPSAQAAMWSILSHGRGDFGYGIGSTLSRRRHVYRAGDVIAARLRELDTHRLAHDVNHGRVRVSRLLSGRVFL